ncbi:MAG: hypothetical protein MI725_08675 [Pirellulales bacterium]|nr:hypothetical protein [Pirellulales bacterium]
MAITACSTPDLSGYADESTKLAALARGELIETGTAFKTIADGDLVTKAKAKQVSTRLRVVDATLTAMVTYSDALKSLSEAGATGGEAVEQTVGHIKKLSDVLGGFDVGTLGLSGAAVEIVTGAAEKIAQFVQAQQANQSLREATAAAHPAVEGMRDILVTLFSYCADNGVPPCDEKVAGTPRSEGTPARQQGQWAVLVTAAADKRLLDVTTAAGDSIIATAKFLQRERDEIYKAYLKELKIAANLPDLPANSGDPTKFCVTERDSDSNKCINGNLIEVVERLEAMRMAMAPEYSSYLEKRDAIDQWQTRRLRNGAKVVHAAIAWAQEYENVVAALQECQYAVFSCRSVDAGELVSILRDAIE